MANSFQLPTCSTHSENAKDLIAELEKAALGSLALDRRVAYEIGFGDPISRRAFGKHGPDMKGSRAVWIPAPYTTCARRALELLPEGDEWDRAAAGKSAPQICVLALEAKAAGKRPRNIPQSTSGRCYWGVAVRGSRNTTQATAARLSKPPKTKLDRQAVGDIEKLIADGLSLRMIAGRFGVSHQTIARVAMAPIGSPPDALCRRFQRQCDASSQGSRAHTTTTSNFPARDPTAAAKV